MYSFFVSYFYYYNSNIPKLNPSKNWDLIINLNLIDEIFIL